MGLRFPSLVVKIVASGKTHVSHKDRGTCSVLILLPLPLPMQLNTKSLNRALSQRSQADRLSVLRGQFYWVEKKPSLLLP